MPWFYALRLTQAQAGKFMQFDAAPSAVNSSLRYQVSWASRIDTAFLCDPLVRVFNRLAIKKVIQSFLGNWNVRAVHACIAYNFVKPFGMYLKVPLTPNS